MSALPRRIGFIGLGNMGYPMVQNLAKKTSDQTKVVVYDVNRSAMQKLGEEYPGKILQGKSAGDVFSQSVSRP